MKKLLIATSALVAVGMTAGAAQAADPIKLSLGGFAYELLTFVPASDNTVNEGGVDLAANNEIHFKGSTTLDNGLTVSFKYELEASGSAQANGANGDEYNISIAGGFGTLVIGADDVATAGAALGAPHFGAFLLGYGADDGGTASGLVGLSGDTQATYIDVGGDSDGVTYVSPAFGGLTASASWKTGDTEFNQDFATGANANDIFAAALLWKGEFNGVGLGAEVGYLSQEDTLSGWQVGAEAAVGGFSAGAAYADRDMDGTIANDYTSWEVGVGYSTGPWGVGLAYASSETDVSATSTRDNSIVQLTSQYSIGPGVVLVAGAATMNQEITGGADEDGWVLQTGIGLSF